MDAVCGAHVTPDMLAGTDCAAPGAQPCCRRQVHCAGCGRRHAMAPAPSRAKTRSRSPQRSSWHCRRSSAADSTPCTRPSSAYARFTPVPPSTSSPRMLTSRAPCALCCPAGPGDARTGDRRSSPQPSPRPTAARADCTYHRGVPATITDPDMTALAQQAIAEAWTTPAFLSASCSMGGEDFSLFLECCPGALLWVGCAPDAQATADDVAAPPAL